MEHGDPKLIVSFSLGSFALFKWKPRARQDSDGISCWLHHGDLLVMDGSCQDQYQHCTDPRLEGELVNVTFRWIRNHVARCPLGLGVVCCLPTCVKDSSVSTNAGLAWPGHFLFGVSVGPVGVCTALCSGSPFFRTRVAGACLRWARLLDGIWRSHGVRCPLRAAGKELPGNLGVGDPGDAKSKMPGT